MSVERLSTPTEQLTLSIDWTGEPETTPMTPLTTAPATAPTATPATAPGTALKMAPTTEGGTFQIDWGSYRATAPFTIVKPVSGSDRGFFCGQS